MGRESGAVEGLDMTLFADIYRGKRVLLTGHTGFKGSWLALWLEEMGASISGIALPPEAHPNHWDLHRLSIDSLLLDIRDSTALQRVFNAVQPEIVFHLAAQPLVRRSYCNPLETLSTNVMGTANVLEACRQTNGVQAIVVVTTDKCYENREWQWGYRETDALGGHDPYSASKAAAELVAASYRSAFFSAENAPILATARAGNVIGGGDWSDDRLIPDLVRAIDSKQSLCIRSPNATRPWQHVLESLSGYLLLGQRLLEGRRDYAHAWNFGPEPESNRTVGEVLDIFQTYWPKLSWKMDSKKQPHESVSLYLDSAQARCNLQWQPVWNLETTVARTTEWYRAWLEGGQVISREQLTAYKIDAARCGCVWSSA